MFLIPTVPDTLGFVNSFPPADLAVPEADGRSARWDSHRASRRVELAQIARKQVHIHGPEISLEDIASAAGTSKSILYRYFTDKSGLQRAVADLALDEIRAEITQVAASAVGPRDALNTIVQRYLRMVESSPHVYEFVTRPAPDGEDPLGHFLAQITHIIAGFFAPASASANLPDDAPSPSAPSPSVFASEAHLWAAGAVGFVRNATSWWLSDEGPRPDTDTFTRKVTSWLWGGPVGLKLSNPNSPTTSPQ